MSEDRVVAELRMIRATLTAAFHGALADSLRQTIRSPKQVAVWNRMAGAYSSADLAKISGLSVRSINMLVAELIPRGLATRNGDGNPMRLVDLPLPEESVDEGDENQSKQFKPNGPQE